MTEPIGTFSGFEVEDLGTLTTTTAGTEVQSGGSSLTFQITVVDIGTDISIRFEGSLDQVGWFNLATNDVDFTITANGTYGYTLGAPVRYVRMNLININGGTPTVSGKVGAA